MVNLIPADTTAHSHSSTAMAMATAMGMALSEGVVVERIVSNLTDVRDLHAASQVSKVWEDVVSWTNRRLTVKSRQLIPTLVHRFKNVTDLNLSLCCDSLHDRDLSVISASLPLLSSLNLGSTDHPQTLLSTHALLSFLSSLPRLHRVTLSSLPNLNDSALHALFTAASANLESLSLHSCKALSDDAIGFLHLCPHLKDLTLNGEFSFSYAGLAKIGESCPGIVKLCLDLDHLDIGAALQSVSSLGIRELRLRFLHGDLSKLSGVSSLVSLHIDTDQYVNVEESLVDIVTANKGLKEFMYFNSRSLVTDGALIKIARECAHLEKVRVFASALTEMSIMCVMELKGLTCLGFGHFNSEGQSLTAIALSTTRLKELSLRLTRNVTDTELETIMYANSPQLERMDLKGCSGPSSRGFSSISVCPCLRILDLSFTGVDDVALAAIASGCADLKQLSLVHCINLSDMKVLSKFHTLEYLNVDQCNFVTDEGLDFVTLGCTKLSHLSMASTRVTDTGLSYLGSCKMLRTLRVPYCRGVQGPGLLTIASLCDWIQYFVISHRFDGTAVLEELRARHCMVQLEVDEMALVPFGFYMRGF